MEETKTEVPEEAPVQTKQIRLALQRAEIRAKIAMNRRVEFAKRAFRRGRAAKFAGYARISTEYENSEGDYFFFAGYDDKDWEAAVASMPA